LDRNTRAILEQAHRVAPKSPASKVISRIHKQKIKADQVLSTATEQVATLRKFLLEKDIVAIPSDEESRVKESPAFMRWNTAFLISAGEFEAKPLPSFYYISPPDPSWPAAERYDYLPYRGELLATTIHEVWPGHFLQYLHEKRNRSAILKTFCSYSMQEGWAHYAEEMMREQGAMGDDPALLIGQISDALLRNVRYLSAIGLHTGGMTVEQALALFKSKAFADTATAKQQAVRGTFDPGYLNYTLGKLMILKLRDDVKKVEGTKFSLRKFHDTFLSFGCAPIPLIRRAMLGENAGPVL
jgi:hypothetical protein